MLGRILDRPVLDKTGLTGQYDVMFQYDAQRPDTIIEGLRRLGSTVTAGKVPIGGSDPAAPASPTFLMVGGTSSGAISAIDLHVSESSASKQ